MLARDRLSLSEMSWILVKVFFGYGRLVDYLIVITFPED